MSSPQTVLLECEKMKQRVVTLQARAQTLYEMGGIAADDFLDIILEERRISAEIAAIEVEATQLSSVCIA